MTVSTARAVLGRAPKGTTWVVLSGGAWRCILPEVAIPPGVAHGRTPLEALAAALIWAGWP